MPAGQRAQAEVSVVPEQSSECLATSRRIASITSEHNPDEAPEPEEHDQVIIEFIKGAA